MTQSKPKTPRSNTGAKALTVHVSRLGEALKARNIALKQSDLIEIAGYAFGYRDGNTLAAAQKSGLLSLSAPSVEQQIRLSTGERLLVLKDADEKTLFAISRDLVVGKTSAVAIAAPSGRLVDVSPLAATLDEQPWALAPFDGTINLTVYVATITHHHGSNQYAALTEADLDRQVAEYCRENWEEVEDKKNAPDPDTATDDEVSSFYFKAIGSESEEFLDTSFHHARVTFAELQDSVNDARKTPGGRSNGQSAPALDPRSEEAWKIAVAKGETTDGYAEWKRGLYVPRKPVAPDIMRQFLMERNEREVIHTLIAGNLNPSEDPKAQVAKIQLPPEKIPLLDAHFAKASWEIGGVMQSNYSVVSLSEAECQALAKALKDQIAMIENGVTSAGAIKNTDPFHMVTLSDRFLEDEPVIYLTNGCCESAHGSARLFGGLGLTWNGDEDNFYPLTDEESKFIWEDSITFDDGEILTSYTGLYRGKKYLMPVFHTYHNAEDRISSDHYADHIEDTLIPRIRPIIESLGGQVKFERDEEDDRQTVQMLIPFAAALPFGDHETWFAHLLNLLQAEMKKSNENQEIRVIEHDTAELITDMNGPVPVVGKRITVKDANTKAWIVGDVIKTDRSGDIVEVRIAITSINGVPYTRTPVALNESDLGEEVFMPLHDAKTLKIGDRILSRIPGMGDVEDEETGEDIEKTFAPGDWLTVTSVDQYPAPQGLAIAVVSDNGVNNTFDENDYGGLYPFKRP